MISRQRFLKCAFGIEFFSDFFFFFVYWRLKRRRQRTNAAHNANATNGHSTLNILGAHTAASRATVFDRFLSPPPPPRPPPAAAPAAVDVARVRRCVRARLCFATGVTDTACQNSSSFCEPNAPSSSLDVLAPNSPLIGVSAGVGNDRWVLWLALWCGAGVVVAAVAFL